MVWGRRIVTVVATTVVSTAVAVAVNVATGSPGNAFAWAAVVVLTGVLAYLGVLALDRSGTDAGAQADDDRMTGIVHAGERSVVVQNLVHGGRSAWQPTALAVAVVLLASVITVVSVWRDPSAPASSDAGAVAGPAAPTGAAPTVTLIPYRGPVCGTTVVVPQTPAELQDLMRSAGPPLVENWRDWAPTRDGVEASPGIVGFTVQGVDAAQVVLSDVRVRVLDRRPAAGQTSLRAACGDPGAYRYLGVDLDRDPPAVSGKLAEGVSPEELKALGEPAWSVTPVRFPYEVSISDAESFVVAASTAATDVTWVVDVDWVSAGRRGTVTLDDGGRPFRTVGVDGIPSSCGTQQTVVTLDCR